LSLKSKLQEDLQEALRARDERRKSVIRMTMAQVQLAEVEQGGELDDAALLAVFQKEVKRRQETIEELERANRPEQLAEARAELAILEGYLPQMMSREEIAAAARQAIAQAGAKGPGDLGAVMRVLMPQVKGRADGRLVNEIVRELLAG